MGLDGEMGREVGEGRLTKLHVLAFEIEGRRCRHRNLGRLEGVIEFRVSDFCRCFLEILRPITRNTVLLFNDVQKTS